jgi:molybdenum cofactor biosynthesis protein B
MTDIDVLPAPGGKLIDQPITPIRIAVLTVSDTRDEESDTSGKVLADRIVRDGHQVAVRGWVRDERGDNLLVAIATGVIADIIINNAR